MWNIHAKCTHSRILWLYQITITIFVTNSFWKDRASTFVDRCFNFPFATCDKILFLNLNLVCKWGECQFWSDAKSCVNSSHGYPCFPVFCVSFCRYMYITRSKFDLTKCSFVWTNHNNCVLCLNIQQRKQKHIWVVCGFGSNAKRVFFYFEHGVLLHCILAVMSKSLLGCWVHNSCDMCCCKYLQKNLPQLCHHLSFFCSSTLRFCHLV